MGILRALLPQQQQPHHCLLRLGQDGQGMLSFLSLKLFICPVIRKTAMYYLTSSLMSFVVMRVKPLYYHRCDIVYLSFPPRCGTWLTASWRPTTLVTVASWTQWQSLLMAPCVHLVEGYETNCFYYCRVLQNDLWSLLTHSELNCTSLCPACRFQQWWKFKMHLFNSDDKEAVSECYLQLKRSLCSCWRCTQQTPRSLIVRWTRLYL